MLSLLNVDRGDAHGGRAAAASVTMGSISASLNARDVLAPVDHEIAFPLERR
jgi:hypothetical protein